MKLTSRILNKSDDFKEYANRYESMSGNKTSLEHFMRVSLVRAFYNQDKEVVGGYSLNANLPIRFYADIPDGTLLSSHPLESDVIEGGGLWVDNDLHPIQRYKICLALIFDTYKLNKPFLVGGAKHPKIARVYLNVLPNIIYEGGVNNSDYACIMYGSRKSLPKIALYMFVRYGIIDTIKVTFNKIKIKIKRRGGQVDTTTVYLTP